MRSYRTYTDQDIIDTAAKVNSLSELLITLGLRNAGGNFDNMKRNLQRLNVDTSHWHSKAWSKDQQLKDWSQYTRGTHLKKHLIKIYGNVCQSCTLSVWLDLPITLEVHHRDGDRTNNTFDNLQLLCPNCHSVTDNWKNRKT
jgi:hypothetical protein